MLDRGVNYGENPGCLSFKRMYMMWNDRVIINGISFFEQVGLFAIIYFQCSFENHDKFFTFMGRQLKSLVLICINVNEVPCGGQSCCVTESGNASVAGHQLRCLRN